MSSVQTLESFERKREFMIQLRSTIICPKCGHRSTETMPIEACQHVYDCKGCGYQMEPKQGTGCRCVYCVYGDVPCPPAQDGRCC
jgi:DNA-directed RNA polymerase subunit RPC12/RpoP